MSEDPAKRRRWFQFGIGELFVLIAVLVVVWWQCAEWPVSVRVPKFTGPSPSATGLDFFMKTVNRPPTSLQVLSRGLAWSSGVVVLWIGGLVALRLVPRGRSAVRLAALFPKISDSTDPLPKLIKPGTNPRDLI